MKNNQKPLLLKPGLASKSHKKLKTQHRRPIELAEFQSTPRHDREFDYQYRDDNGVACYATEAGLIKKHSKYQVGDHLYIREKWRVAGWGQTEYEPLTIEYSDVETQVERGDENLYSVFDVESWRDRLFFQTIQECEDAKIPTKDEYYDFDNHELPTRWRSSIHMPKWCSRTWVEVVEVRVERLLSITQVDAIDEGVVGWEGFDDKYYKKNFPVYHKGYQAWKERGDKSEAPPLGPTPKQRFLVLWDSIYGNRHANPWVFVYTYKKIEVQS